MTLSSFAVESFWESYFELTPNAKKSAKKACRLWAENPFHPSLSFKCINSNQNIWSVRITLGVRALCLYENSTVTWFWVGDHDAYEKFFWVTLKPSGKVTSKSFVAFISWLTF